MTASPNLQTEKVTFVKCILPQWLAAGLPVHATDRVLPVLRQHLHNGGWLPVTSSGLGKYKDQVILEQNYNIKAHLLCEQQHGWSVMLDETCDNRRDLCPLNIIFVTHLHMYFVDTIYLEDDEVNGAGEGQRFIDWWGKFFEGDGGQARQNVAALVMDNAEYMSKAYHEHLRPYFPNGVQIRFISHTYNLIGKAFWEHQTMLQLRQFAMHC